MQQSMGSQRVRRDLATEQQQEVIFTSAGCSIHCRQGSIQHLDRRAVASSSPYCGSLTDDDCRITFKEVSPSVSLLPLFLIPVTPVSSLGSEQSFAHAFFFFCHVNIISPSPPSFSVYPHGTVVKFKFSEILPGHYSLHTSFKSTGHPAECSDFSLTLCVIACISLNNSYVYMFLSCKYLVS